MGKKTVIGTDNLATKANAASPASAGPLNNGRQAKMATSKRTLIILATVSTILIIVGVVLGLCWMQIYHSFLFTQLVLTPTSRTYNTWKEIPIPMYLNLYLYNWTNPEEFVVNSTIKPNFVQMGPYVFREDHIKVNQVWNDNGTITFQQRRVWQFEESMTNGSLDDEITNVNVIAATVGFFVRDEVAFIRRLVNGFLEHYNQTFTVTKTARELLFEGYEDDLLTFVKDLNSSLITIPFDKFGWFYGRNGSDTYDGVFNMLTGTQDISNLGMLKNWNYRDRTDHWSDECNMIRGSTGELWPPLTDNEKVEIFAPDICTSIIVSRTNDSQFSGITGHTFIANQDTFDNGTNVPSRACYCSNGTCEASGVLDVATCKFGAPAFVGLPHFYMADESYRNAITGMEPLDEKYNFKMTLEPNTGIPLDVAAQMQINVLAQPIEDLTIFTDIPRVFIPVLWFRQDAKLTDDFAQQIKFLLILPTLGHATFIAIACIGLSLALTTIYLWYQRRSRRGDNQLLITADDTGNPPRANPVTS